MIFCFDYDMTLYDHRTMSIPASALDTIRRLQGRHKIILASGRNFHQDKNPVIDDILRPDGVVYANGALVEADGRILRESYFDRELKKKLIQYVQLKNYRLLGMSKGVWYTSNTLLFEKHIQSKNVTTTLPGSDFLSLIDQPVFSFFLDDTNEAAEDIQASFPELDVYLMSSFMGGADIIPKGINKASGVSVLLEYWKEDFENVIAIGDSMNDYELIRRAGMGIAVGNALDVLKEAADYVSKDIMEDGIKIAVEYALSHHRR